ncbi:MAG: hypothetical protein MJ089_08640 [Ruminococcus sp.]|nr:hypothetical protein [Ruminococcus sp.]
MKSKIKKITSITLILTCLMSMLSSLAVNAAGQTTITLEQKDDIYYADGWGWTCVPMIADGKQVYCVQPDLPAPDDGVYSTSNNKLQEINTNDRNYNMYLKALYYCYGGDGFDTEISAFKTDTSKHYQEFAGNSPAAFMGNLKYSYGGYEVITNSGWKLHYILTHLLLSYIYYGDSYWSKTAGKVPTSGYEDAIKDLYSAIQKAPVPDVSFSLYMLNVGSSRQKVIVIRQNIRLQLQKDSANTSLTANNSCYSLEGAKYNIYLDKNCKEYFGYISTDKNGYGKFGAGTDGVNVPLQNYYAKEVEAPKGYALDDTVYQFKNSGRTTSDGTPIYSFRCVDQPMNDPVMIMVRKQGENGTYLEGAEFTIKYYKDYYDETNVASAVPEKTWVFKTDKDGYADLSSNYLVSGDEFYYSSAENPVPVLPLGTITIQETKAPEGYMLDERVYVRQITEPNKKTGSNSVNTYNPPTVVDEVGAGYVKLIKTDKENNKPVKGAMYGLYTSNICGTNRIISKGLVGVAVTDENGEAVFYSNNADEDNLTSDDYLFEFGSYFVQEIFAPTGYYLDLSIYPVTIDGSNKTVDTSATVKISEEKTSVSLDKVDSNGNRISGATMQLLSASGSVIEEWVTDGINSHLVTGKVSYSNKYILHEKTAPAGFVKADDVEFYFYENNLLVQMIDEPTKVEITKTDITGEKEVEGAYLTVSTSNGTIVDSWYSSYNSHIIENLVIGEQYTLTEVISPVGYATANAIKFTLKEDGSVTKVTMKDDTTKVSFAKVDKLGKYIGGAELQLFDSSNKLVDEWTTVADKVHTIEGILAVGASYTLHENKAPAGKMLAEDITFTVTDTSDIQTVTMTDLDTTIEVYKTDITGTKEIAGAKLQIIDSTGRIVKEWISSDKPEKITELVQNKTYTLHEELPPETFATAEDVLFTVKESGITKVYMKDDYTKTEITKYDVTGSYEVAGAEFELTDYQGKLVDSWTSTNEAHIISGLVAGLEYTLTETKAPNGYKTAEPVIFTVKASGVTKVFVKDEYTKVEVDKVDENGNSVKAAVLQILDNNKAVVTEFTTDGKTKVLEGVLNENETYYLHEVSAPNGYALADDIKFTVSDGYAYIKMIDKFSVGSITLYKQDSNGNSLAGSEWQLYTSDDKAVAVTETGSGEYIMNGSTSTMQTDENGVLLIDKLEQGSYYLIETKAPVGKNAYSKKIDFTINDTKLNKTITVKDTNVVLYQTGGYRMYMYILGGVLILLAISLCIVYYIKFIKKHDK